jgi:O-6-methylguanine DNA methyltransferase
MSKQVRGKSAWRIGAATGGDVILFGGLSTRRFPKIWIAASRKGLVAIEIGASRADFETWLSHRTRRPVRFSPGRVRAAASQIREYLEGARRSFRVRIDWSEIHTPFQRRALSAVLSIPYGQTRSYKQIAAQIGQPRAIRAVGRANATNPLPLVIPCHRVIGADGDLRGYGGAGGIKTKAWLLGMEASRARSSAQSAFPCRRGSGFNQPERTAN